LLCKLGGRKQSPRSIELRSNSEDETFGFIWYLENYTLKKN
jgi:hypothetical protein